MALKNVKTAGSGGKSHGRYVTRVEVKTATKKLRRVEDLEAEEEIPPVVVTGIDVAVENHGSLCLLRPVSSIGEKWLVDNIHEPMYLGTAVAVEPRLLSNVVDGMQEAGLELEFKN